VNIAVKPQGVRESDAYILPLAELNPAQTDRFQDDTIWPVFERLRREAAGHSHPRDRVGVLDVGLAEGRLLLTDVLGADDAVGNMPGGRKPARVEQSGHVLQF